MSISVFKFNNKQINSPQPKGISFTMISHIWQRKATNLYIWNPGTSRCLAFFGQNAVVLSLINRLITAALTSNERWQYNISSTLPLSDFYLLFQHVGHHYTEGWVWMLTIPVQLTGLYSWCRGLGRLQCWWSAAALLRKHWIYIYIVFFPIRLTVWQIHMALAAFSFALTKCHLALQNTVHT